MNSLKYNGNFGAKYPGIPILKLYVKIMYEFLATQNQ